MSKKIKNVGLISGIVLVIIFYGFLFFNGVKSGAENYAVKDKLEAFLREEKYEELVSFADSKLETNPKSFTLLSYKGYALVSMGENEKGIESLIKALKIEPSDDSVLNNLSWAYNNLEKYEEALHYSSRALELSPYDEYALVNQGNALLGLKRYGEAGDSYNSAIEENKDSSLAYYGRGVVNYETEKYDKAIVDFIMYTTLEPDDIDGYIYLGQAYMGVGNYKNALDKFEAAIKINPNDLDLYLSKADALEGDGRYEESLASCDRAIEIDPSYTDAYVTKGKVYYHMGKYNEALKLLDKAIELEPSYSTPYSWKGDIYIDIGEYAKSVDFCKKAVAKNPGDIYALNTMGRAYYLLNDYSSALKAIDKAIEIDNYYEEAYVGKTMILFAQENYLDCTAFVNDAIRLFPDNKELLWYQADLLSNSLKYEEAIKVYEKVLKLDEFNDYVLMDMAWTHYHNQDYGKSKEYLDRVQNTEGLKNERELLGGLLKEASLPEGQRIINFIKDNYMYLKDVKDFDKKAKEFQKIKEPEIVDIYNFLSSVISKGDRFSGFIYGDEYEAVQNEEFNLHIKEKLIREDASYIGIPLFTENIDNEFIAAVNNIQDPGAKALLLDLRDNPGGSIDSANVMLDYLLGNTVTSSLVYKNGETRNYSSDKEHISFKRIVIMVNGNSASSSEILALSLKKHLKNVTIIGKPTFGKGVGQLVFDNKKKKYSIYLTSFNWNVNKNSVPASGLKPDILVEGESESDYLEAFYKLINSQGK